MAEPRTSPASIRIGQVTVRGASLTAAHGRAVAIWAAQTLASGQGGADAECVTLRLPATTNAYLVNFVGIVTMGTSILILREHPSIVQVVGALVAVLGLRLFFATIPPPSERIGLVHVGVGVLVLAVTNTVARKLVEGGVETYSAERHPVGARVIRQTRALTRLMTVRQPIGRFLRDQLFARVIGNSALIQRALVRRIMGLA